MANKTKAAPPAPKAEEGRKIPIEKLEGSRYTVEEMQAHIDKWLNTPVSLGQRKEG